MELRIFNNSLLGACMFVVILGLHLSCVQSDIVPEGITDSSILDEGNAWFVVRRKELFHLRDGLASSANHLVANEPVLNVFFLTKNTGWLITMNDQIWFTKNGGQDWVIRGSISPKWPGLSRGVFFRNETDGWILELNAIWYTLDGGSTWKTVSLGKGTESSEPLDIFANQTGNCFVGMTKGKVLIGNGDNWKVSDLPTTDDIIKVVSTERKVFAISHTGKLFEADGGNHEWRESVVPTGVNVIDTNDNGQVWLGLQKQVEHILQGQLITSLDSEMNWKTLSNSLPPSRLSNLQFIDPMTAVAIGFDDVFLTRNGGSSWELVHKF